MTYNPTLGELADEFAQDFGDCLERYVARQHPGNPYGWPNAAQRETSRRLRAAIAAKLIGETDEQLRDLIDACRAADNAVSRYAIDEFGAVDAVEAAEARAAEIVASYRDQIEEAAA